MMTVYWETNKSNNSNTITKTSAFSKQTSIISKNQRMKKIPMPPYSNKNTDVYNYSLMKYLSPVSSVNTL